MPVNPASTGINVNELIDLAGVRECLQFFTREKQWINEAHLEFCRIPAPTFLEAERAAWFQEKFRSLGWDSSIDRAGNVIASLGTRTLHRRDRASRYRPRASQQRGHRGGCRWPFPRPRRLRQRRGTGGAAGARPSLEDRAAGRCPGQSCCW